MGLKAKWNAFRDSNRAIGGATLLPIRLTLIYLVISILMYEFGVFDWVTYKPILFYGLMISYLTALWVGYRVGVRRPFPKAIEWKESFIDRCIPALTALLVFGYILYVVNVFRSYGLKTFDFPELFRRMAVGISNPGLGYAMNRERIMTLDASMIMGGAVVSLINYVWAFLRYPVLLFSMIYFKKLPLVGKIVMIMYLITMVLYYLSIGTTIDILTVFLWIELPVLLRAFTAGHEHRLDKKQIIRLLAGLLAGIVFIACYFGWMMLSRGGINNYDQPEYNVGGVHLSEGTVSKDPDNGDGSTSSSISQYVPPIVMKVWISATSYLTQGYYGMSQALTLPWVPMYGVGNSMFCVDFISDNICDVDQYTYQVRMEPMGWDSDIQWHSMYTWLANDVSFFGVILVMFVIGLLFGAMFRDAITTANPFAKISVFYFILMMLFIPCNNQIAQKADTLFSFILVVACWLISKYPPKFIRNRLSKQEA